MAENSAIEWTDATWNPIVGCSVVSPGCTNCYAMKLAYRLDRMGSPIYRGLTMQTKSGPVWTGKIEQSNWGIRTAPLRWRRPRRIFVNSMSDLFHESVPDAWIDEVFAVMALCPQHTFQVLTKRAERMLAYLDRIVKFDGLIWHECDNLLPKSPGGFPKIPAGMVISLPLPNVWLGVSIEDQRRADDRIPHLLATPAAVRFLSCEPLLGPIKFSAVPGFNRIGLDLSNWWVICGGESGPHKRPMNLEWARSLRDQCAAAGVPFFGKQWDKVQPLPTDLMVRQFPETTT